MTQEVKRIAMWSGPRNISTAMMRSFENRPDTAVIDEPFYAFYLDRTGDEHPRRDQVIASQPTEPTQVIKQLMGPVKSGVKIFYQKQMTHHLLPEVDLSALDGLNHVFLIRDPRAMVASYVRSRDTVAVNDMGMQQMWDLFQRTSDRLGFSPPVLDSKAVLQNPEIALRGLCAAIDIPFDAAMLSWPAGKRDSDGAWASHWYGSVEKSTGFMPYAETDITLSAHEESVAAQCMPFYEKMQKFC